MNIAASEINHNEIALPLTSDEKAQLKSLIDADAPLPSEYRARLFPEPPGVRIAWPGKHAACPALDADPPALWTVERYGRVDGWRDRLFLGDNTAVLRTLQHGSIRDQIEAAGGLRLIYLDPPFLTGRAFAADVPIGETVLGKPARAIRLPAYDDGRKGGLAAYLDAMLVRLRLMRDLLADDGSLYFHCDHRLAAAMRLLLDEVFGPDRLVNEIVWHYGLGNPGGRRAFARKHDTILLYSKTESYRFNRLRGEITPAMAGKYRHQDETGRYLISYGKKYYLQGGKPLDTVWTIPTLAATDSERVGYPTQKPEALLERILLASSDPGDLVADFCCGSGVLPAVAARIDRRWLAADASPRAIQTVRTRLLGSGVSGFELLEVDGATLPREDTGVVSVVAEIIGGALRVRLTGYDPPLDTPEPRPDAWSDWIETWAVAIDPLDGVDDHAPFTPIWWTARSGRNRTLALVTDAIPTSVLTSFRVLVHVVDVLGRTFWGTVEIRSIP